MKRCLIGSACAVLVFAMSTPASAYVVSTSAGTYDVTTILGTYNEVSATLTNQVWWSSSGLADEFAVAVGGNLGFPNNFIGLTFGPVFAYAPGDATDFVGTTLVLGGSVISGDFSKIEQLSFAVATEVPTSLPEPGTLGLLALGLMGIAWIRWRKIA